MLCDVLHRSSRPLPRPALVNLSTSLADLVVPDAGFALHADVQHRLPQALSFLSQPLLHTVPRQLDYFVGDRRNANLSL